MQRHCSNWIQSYVQLTSKNEAPTIYHEWAAIFAISSAMRRKCCLRWADRYIYPNMYIVFVGPPAIGKNTAMMYPDRFLRTLNIPRSSAFITKEALIGAMERQTTEVDLGYTIEKHCTFSILSEEFSVFIGQQNPGLMNMLTDWFDNKEEWSYETKTAGTNKLQNVFISLLGGATQQSIGAMFPDNLMIGTGFASRIIFVYADKKSKFLPFPVFTEDDKILEQQLLQDLEQIAGLRGIYQPTQDFIRFWLVFAEAQQLEQVFPPYAESKFEGYLGRRDLHIRKLAMIIRAAKSNDFEITEEDIMDALTLLKRTEIEMVKTFGQLGQSKHASVLTNILALLSRQKVTEVHTLYQRYMLDASVDEINAMLEGFCAMKKCRWTTLDKTKIEYIGG